MKPARVAPEAIALLLRHLAGAQRGGLPLPDALTILAQDSSGGRAATALVSDLGRRVGGGEALSGAMRAHPAAFAPEAVELVRAAEAENALGEALELLAADYESRALQRAAMRGALAWPAAIVVVLLLLLAFVTLFVMPMFKQTFASFGADLPEVTLLVMGGADVLGEYWYLWVALIVVAAAYLLRGAGLPGSAWIERGLLRLPFVRPYLIRTFVARVSRALGAATTGRLPLAPALAYLGATAGNRALSDSAAAVEAQVRAGKGLAAAVRASPHLPAQLVVALELGERSNNLGPALRQLVAVSEGDAARSLMRLQQAILVGTYLGLGLTVALVVIALYLPIFRIGAAV